MSRFVISKYLFCDILLLADIDEQEGLCVGIIVVVHELRSKRAEMMYLTYPRFG
jgi:hypothetical protein